MDMKIINVADAILGNKEDALFYTVIKNQMTIQDGYCFNINLMFYSVGITATRASVLKFKNWLSETEIIESYKLEAENLNKNTIITLKFKLHDLDEEYYASINRNELYAIATSCDGNIQSVQQCISVLLALKLKLTTGYGYVFKSYTLIEEISGLNHRTVLRYINLLEENNIIAKGNPNYRLRSNPLIQSINVYAFPMDKRGVSIEEALTRSSGSLNKEYWVKGIDNTVTIASGDDDEIEVWLRNNYGITEDEMNDMIDTALMIAGV